MCPVCDQNRDEHDSSSYICAEVGKKWPFLAKVDMEQTGDVEFKNDGKSERFHVWKVKDRPNGECGWKWLKELKSAADYVKIVCA